jgi:putative tryptophan/tyrosine transport system substrate-binding protein
MKRREFIAGLGSAAAWPVAGRAQQAVRRVGVLTFDIDIGLRPSMRGLREELQKLGWIEGRNLRLEIRFGSDDTQTGVSAVDLVQLDPDVIVTTYLVALRAVQQQTKTIPIVFIGTGDPIESGAVRNPAHPEGNATGLANAFGSLGGKWLELLKVVAPNVTRVLCLYAAGSSYLRSVGAAAQSLGVQVVAIAVSDANGMKAAIEAFAAEPNGGLIPTPGAIVLAPRELTRWAAQYRLPLSSSAGFATAGGLIGYGADVGELYRGGASYVDRLLRGAKVSDLPVQYPTKFELVINLKTAKALGLTIPETLLATADEVIQ